MATLLASIALCLAGCNGVEAPPAAPPQTGTGAAPAPDETLPGSPRALATRLTAVSLALRRSIDRWLATRPGPGAAPPQDVQLPALYQQRAFRRMAPRPRFARATLALLPRALRGEATDEVAALHDLYLLTNPANEKRFKTQRPPAPGRLYGFYGAAQRRFHVRWDVLAAVNLVESGFGRLRNDSIAGAQGPMQFIRATWRAYGLGGNVHDPHDAILGAANYLHASGAPRSYSRALFSYNNSSLYVSAVLHFARRMAIDRRTYYALWSWQVFVRTRRGDVRLTGPGR